MADKLQQEAESGRADPGGLDPWKALLGIPLPDADPHARRSDEAHPAWTKPTSQTADSDDGRGRAALRDELQLRSLSKRW